MYFPKFSACKCQLHIDYALSNLEKRDASFAITNSDEPTPETLVTHYFPLIIEQECVKVERTQK